MPLKCCVPECESNYKSSGGVYVSVYKLPSDENERKKWISASPRANIVITKYTAVCRRHWPDDAEFSLYYGKLRTIYPPSVFPNLPPSCLSSIPQKRRTTLYSSSSTGNVIPDEIDQFIQQDILTFDYIEEKICKDSELVVYREQSDVVVIQSKKFKCGVPRFVLKVKDDLTYTSFHCGSSCTIESLSSNRITICKYWSILNEIIRFLKNKEESHKTFRWLWWTRS